jgi:CheY-like chemotaxis protein
VARILICEPHNDISALLELVVRRLGHDPLRFAGGDLAALDVAAAVVEPGDDDALQVARALRARDVPVLFTSIYPPDDELLELRPVTYLVKPFALDALERALRQALTTAPHPPAAATV